MVNLVPAATVVKPKARVETRGAKRLKRKPAVVGVKNLPTRRRVMEEHAGKGTRKAFSTLVPASFARKNTAVHRGRLFVAHPTAHVFDVIGDNVSARQAARERLSLIDDLKKLGFDVLVTFSRGAPVSREKERFLALAERKGARKVSVEVQSDTRAIWPRDHFSVIGGKSHVLPKKTEFVTEKTTEGPGGIVLAGGHYRALRRNGRPETFTGRSAMRRRSFSSSLGEGGAVIPLGEKAILVSRSKRRFAREEISALEKRGFKVFELPESMFEVYTFREGGKTHRVFEESKHIDLNINAVPGRNLLVVDEYYYKENKELIDRIKLETGYETVVSPGSESRFLPANFFDVAPNAVLVNRGAKETIKRLKAAGVKVARTSMPIRAHTILHGGIRCSTNLPRGTMRRTGLAEQPKPSLS